MSTRTPFIAPVVDIAAQFIKNRGAVTVSELAVYLSAAGVNVVGDAEFAGEELAYLLGQSEELAYLLGKEVPALPVIASGSTEFVRTIAALLVNRRFDLDATNPALLKLTWDGRWDDDREASTPMKDKSRTGDHYHILKVRDPGRSQQIAECWAGDDFGLALQHFRQAYFEVYFRDSVNEGWDATCYIKCGPDRCRRDDICDPAAEESGSLHWADTTVFPGVDDSFNAPNSELADEPPF
jgi:hypothetical protein